MKGAGKTKFRSKTVDNCTEPVWKELGAATVIVEHGRCKVLVATKTFRGVVCLALEFGG